MIFIAFFTLLLVASEYFGLLSSRTPATPRWPPWIWIVALAGSYAAQLAVVAFAATHQYPSAPWRSTMPFAVVDDRGLETLHADALTGLALALAALQSYALLALYRTNVARASVWAGCGAMLVLSLVSPGLISFDPYGYVHDAILGLRAYSPPNLMFPGEYRVFDLWFGGPSPTLYGPLWLALIKVVTAAGSGLAAKIIAWRAFCALTYVAFLFALRAYGAPARVVTVAALNPGLMLQFVANAHNDIVAIALLVFAAAMMRRGLNVAALGTIAVAGLIKLPYAILGLPILAAMRPLWARFSGAAVMLIAVVALSWIGGGSAYFGTLFGHVTARPEDIVHRLAGIVALIALAAAFLGRRRLRSAVWIVPMLAAAVFSWYFVWGTAYALARRRILAYLLVCFPFVTVLFDSAFERGWELLIVLPIVALVSIFAPEKRFKRVAPA